MRRTARCPAEDARSIAMLRLLRLSARNEGLASPSRVCAVTPKCLASSPRPGSSTLTMSAPRSPRICVAAGPANTRERSSTRMPVSTFHIAELPSAGRRMHDRLADGDLESLVVLAPDIELVDVPALCVLHRAAHAGAGDDRLILVDRSDVLRAQPALACGFGPKHVDEQPEDPVGRDHAVGNDPRQAVLFRVVVVVVDRRRLRDDAAGVGLHRLLDVDVPAHPLARPRAWRGAKLMAGRERGAIHRASFDLNARITVSR